MHDDRTRVVTINGIEYPMAMNGKAAIEILKKYGSLEEMGEALDDTDDTAAFFTNILWLMTLLINQGISMHNYMNKESQRDLIDEDFIGVISDPREMMSYRESVISAFSAGSIRHIESGDENPKNAGNG
jgi:hypothetical protein